MAYDNTDSGALFKNDKIKSSSSPQYRGSAECKCPECGAVSKFWISAWVKTMKGKAEKFMSLAFTPDDTNVNKTPTSTKPDSDDGWDDDIPF